MPNGFLTRKSHAIIPENALLQASDRCRQLMAYCVTPWPLMMSTTSGGGGSLVMRPFGPVVLPYPSVGLQRLVLNSNWSCLDGGSDAAGLSAATAVHGSPPTLAALGTVCTAAHQLRICTDVTTTPANSPML